MKGCESPCFANPCGRLLAPIAVALALGAGLLLPAGRAGAAPPGPSPPGARARESFARVRPILSRSCAHCHGPEKPKRDLDLTRLDTLVSGGKSGSPIVPGKSRESLLVRVLLPGNDPHMPPKKQLAPDEIDAISTWIDGLSPELSIEDLRKDSIHWAFRKVDRPPIPAVKHAAWVRSPIDAFILSKLEEEGIEPSPEAAKHDLIRRAYLDLIGLPPSPEEVDAFLGDASEEAFDRVIDRLLASPHHGERWGRHWLDLARFAESEGFKSDETRPNAWRYRDYVVRSLNEDKPYDRFVLEQIAGDELWPADADARLATAFNRHYPDESNARELYQRRQEILNDITDTVGLVFLGLTVGCARCHDHKYDPFPQADYYRLQAFFANVRAVDDLAIAPEERAREHRAKFAVWEEKTRHLTGEMASIEEAKRKQLAHENLVKFPLEIQAAIAKPEAERTPLDRQMCFKAKPYLYPEREVIVNALSKEAKARWQAIKGEVDKFKDLHPGELPVGSAIADAGREAPRTHRLLGGGYNAPLEPVEPAFPAAIDPSPVDIDPPEGIESTGRRTALARWLARPENPLTARVIVNRVWQYHFGAGIVGTPSDFGTMGDPPTHPGLLDWLACELVDRGWSLKELHRLILRSSVYRQASRYRPEAARIDPRNQLWWRFPRQRLEAEALRDAALAAAGLLDRRIGGPSVFPELPAGVDGYGKWPVARDAGERNRRSIYIFVRRNTRYPFLECFDFPDTHDSCARRHSTITAPQALVLMNGALGLAWARGFAARVIEEAGPRREDRVDRAYRIAYSRRPDAEEMTLALAFLEEDRAIVAGRAAAGEKTEVPSRLPGGFDPAEAAALVDLCHTILNSNEFIDRN